MKRFCAIVFLLAWAFCASAAEKSGIVVSINGAKYYIHTVQAGETLYTLAKTYEVGEQVIVENNPAVAHKLQAGVSLKIPYVAATVGQPSEKKLRKTFDMHYVSEGETLYAIARQYAIPIQTVIDDNPSLDPIRLRPGERILIRKKMIGSESEADSRAEWEEYRSSLSSVAEPGSAYHIVRAGETFYSLARRFGITEKELVRLNNGLRPADLKAGAIIRVPASPEKEGAGEQRRPESAFEPQPGQSEQPDASAPEIPIRPVEEIEFRALRRTQPLRVALLLPLETEGSAPNVSYLEFYQGFLLGVDSVKNHRGYSVDVTLFNTARDSAKIERIIESDEFRRSDLIVGPVYEEELEPVVRYAEERGIPVVSPLAHIERMNSDVLFQLAPDPACKYEKAAGLFDGEHRITLIYTAHTDEEFEAEILTLIGDNEYRRHTYKYEHPNDIARRTSGYSPADLTPLLGNEEENVFIIMADNEIDVDRILAALASADTSITARGQHVPNFVVLGNARWNRYGNIDRTMFFKDRTIFLSTYHAKRDNAVVKAFDGAYIRAFNALPTLYSYRGFDTAMIFLPAMYNDIEYDMEGRRYTPLQTSYVFGQDGVRHNHVNRNWTRVNYQSDYTITIE
ncbi:MAG: LysM peptidoglycan-binding domain-containing protein [Alistipes sp.]|nr:LysM peptidoglycan-binding domain-containing protein [Alistipes senegalensis]MCM1250407.1 LysM peptidoglycan-binding domain-containing protein [Alistipes sp.]